MQHNIHSLLAVIDALFKYPRKGKLVPDLTVNEMNRVGHCFLVLPNVVSCDSFC
jgi:hypothetical protein